MTDKMCSKCGEWPVHENNELCITCLQMDVLVRRFTPLEPGTKTTCRICDAALLYNGNEWVHVESYPSLNYHPAFPTGGLHRRKEIVKALEWLKGK